MVKSARWRGAFICVAAALALAGCATAPSGYGPALSAGGIGYTEQKVEIDRYRVTYRDRSLPQAEDGALRRAAELTLAGGFDWFTVVTRRSGRDDRGWGVRPSVGIGGSTGGRRGGVGVGVQLPLGRMTPEEVTVLMEIRMGLGVGPAGNQTYNARSVLENLVPRGVSGQPYGR